MFIKIYHNLCVGSIEDSHIRDARRAVCTDWGEWRQSERGTETALLSRQGSAQEQPDSYSG